MLTIYELENQIRTAMRQTHVPGLAIAVVYEGHIFYAKGFGVTNARDDALDVKPETLFRMGSVTKPLTATMIMTLVQQGKLDLDKPVADYVDWLRLGIKGEEKQITLRMLLSHTAGIPNGLSYTGSRDYHALKAEIINTFSAALDDDERQPLVVPPGTAYYYSNLGINLAGYIAESVMDAPYTELMQRTVFQPLEMWRTTFDPNQAMTYPLALPHILSETERLYVMRPFIDNTAHYPCGFAMSNVVDLAQFVLMHMDTGVHQILNQAALREMHTPITYRYTPNRAGYGLGFRSYDYKGLRLVGHNGAIGKYGAWLWMCQEVGLGVVMMCNRAPQFWVAADEILTAVFDDMLDLPKTYETAPGFIPDKTTWTQYTGTFLGDAVGLVHLNVVDDDLQITLNGQTHTLQPAQAGVYHAPHNNLSLGLLNRDMIMVNGNVCLRYDYTPYEFDVSQEYEGEFVADIDTFSVRVDGRKLYIYSMDDRREVAYTPLDERTFAGNNGIITFDEVGGDHLTWQRAFLFTRKPGNLI